jgi:hypothetical protein
MSLIWFMILKFIMLKVLIFKCSMMVMDWGHANSTLLQVRIIQRLNLVYYIS